MWKHILTNRDPDNFVQITDLSRLASSRKGHFELGGPAFIEAHVPSHDFRVYFPTDDEFALGEFDPFYLDDAGFINYPRLAEGLRMMFSFRRESPPDGDPWVIRHAGPVLELEDEANTETGTSRFVAYDPWAYLYQRPVRLSEAVANLPLAENSTMPGEKGTVFPAGTTGNTIVCQLLKRTIAEDGLTYIDAGPLFGGTSSFGGTLETTAAFIDPVIFPRGTTVGQAWEQMVDTGTLDIILTPIWDPLNRPGYCAELNVVVGTNPGLEVFAGYPSFRWDRTGHHLTAINRLQEGRERANRIRAYAGGTGAANAPWVRTQGAHGPTSAGDDEATWSDGDSRNRYGVSWAEATYVRQTAKDVVSRQAENELLRRRQGLRTWRLTPTPEFSPRPFQDYRPGTYIGFYHSRRLREEQWWIPQQFNDQTIYPRIFAFDIAISDDALESVSALDISLDIPPPDTNF